MERHRSHAIVLDRNQADVLWRVDAAWRESSGDKQSPFGAAARNIGVFDLDPTLSDWEVPASALTEISSLVVSLSDHLPTALARAAKSVVDELIAVRANRAVRPLIP